MIALLSNSLAAAASVFPLESVAFAMAENINCQSVCRLHSMYDDLHIEILDKIAAHAWVLRFPELTGGRKWR